MYDADTYVWQIRQDYGDGNVYNFKNLANGKYLKTYGGDNCYDGIITGGGTAAMWDLNSRVTIGAQSYRREYVLLKNPTYDGCCTSSGYTDTTIEFGECFNTSAVIFEILDHAPTTFPTHSPTFVPTSSPTLAPTTA
eukprot:361633_1